MSEVSVPFWIDTPVGTLAFNQRDANGDGLFILDVQGLDYPTIRAPMDNRPNLDGAILYNFLKGQRIPMISGELRFTHGYNGNPNDLTGRRLAEDNLRACLDSILRNDGLLRWQPTGATAVTTSGNMTLSGHEITDAIRQSGRSGDGRVPEGSTGIWQGTTNVVTNGGLESGLSGWTAKNSSVGGSIAYVRRTCTHTDNISQTSFTMQPAVNMTSGNTLLMTVCSAGGKLVSSVTDTKSNTWVIDNTAASNVVGVTVLRMSGGTALTTSDTMTVNMSGSAADHCASVDEFSGLLTTSNPVDVKANAAIGGSATALSVGPTSNTVNATDLVYAGLGWKGGGSTVTASGFTAGYTTLAAVNEGAGLNETSQAAYKILNSTGPQTIAATLSTSSFWSATIQTYKNAGTVLLSQDNVIHRFGTQSLRLTTPGSTGQEGMLTSATASPSTTYTASAYVNAPNGAALEFILSELSSGVQQTSHTKTFTGTGSWQQVTFTWATGTPCDTINFAINTQATLSTTFWIDGVQLEASRIVTPYVETSNGALSRGGAEVLGPATNLSTSQGWFAVRARFDWGSGSPPGGGSGVERLLYWADSSTSLITVIYDEAAGAFKCRRQSTSLDSGTTAVTTSIANGDIHTVIGAWDTTGVYLSVDGSAFTFAPQTGIPSLAANSFDIGSNSGTSEFLDGDVFWAAIGVGTLGASDLTALNGTGNLGPGASTVSNAALLTIAWNAASSIFTGGSQIDQRSCTVRLLEPVQILNQQNIIKGFQINLVAADPNVYSVVVNSVTSNPPGVNTSSTVQGTWIFPFTFPVVFGDFVIPGTVGDEAICVNGGNAATWPVITLNGPYTAPTITNLSTGFSMSFPGLTMNSSDVLVINMQAQTILLNGSQAIHFLNMAATPSAPSSTFFQLTTGSNSIQINDTLQDTSTASMLVQWRNGWI